MDFGPLFKGWASKITVQGLGLPGGWQGNPMNHHCGARKSLLQR